jgi:twitching motility protein PilI
MSSANAAFEKLLEYERLARQFGPGADGEISRHGEAARVIFRIGDDQLTCSVDKVHEFLPLPAFTRVPGTKPWILGLANIRGDLVAIIDLAWFLKGEQSDVTMRSRVLIASLRGRPVGLLVDEVFGHRNFVDSDTTDSKQPEGSPLRDYVHRQLRSGQESWGEFDLDALFNSANFLNGAVD